MSGNLWVFIYHLHSFVRQWLSKAYNCQAIPPNHGIGMTYAYGILMESLKHPIVQIRVPENLNAWQDILAVLSKYVQRPYHFHSIILGQWLDISIKWIFLPASDVSHSLVQIYHFIPFTWIGNHIQGFLLMYSELPVGGLYLAVHESKCSFTVIVMI